MLLLVLLLHRQQLAHARSQHLLQVGWVEARNVRERSCCCRCCRCSGRVGLCARARAWQAAHMQRAT